MTRPCSEILRELRGMLHISPDIDACLSLYIDGTYIAQGESKQTLNALATLRTLLAEADAALKAHQVEHFFDNAAVPPGHPRAPAPVRDEPVELEALAAKLHEIYQQEAKRQGDVRHHDDYADLSEPTKDFDRALARWIIETYASPQPAPDGWQLVPKEPTEDMLKAMGYADPDPDPDEDLFGWPRSEYKGALAAAPLPPPPASEPSE